MVARRYVVVGTGGIGGFYGARLQAAGFAVTFVGRSDVDALNRDGLHVASPEGAIDLDQVRAVRTAAEAGPADVVVVTTKTTGNDDLPALVGALAGEQTLMVSMQNGFGVDQQLAEAAPGSTVLGALCFICSTRVAPGRIEHLDYGNVTLGEHAPDGRPAGVTDAVRRVTDDLTAAGIGVSTREDLVAARWQKLMWNVPFNGMSVALDRTTESLVRTPETRARARRLMAELEAAAHAHGHPVGADFADKMIRNTEEMAPYAPSMKLDFDAGRPMELAAIYDRPLAVAASLGVAMPEVGELAAQLHAMDRGSAS